MKLSQLAVLGVLISVPSFAGTPAENCVAKAKENVEAISQIMYAPKELNRARTSINSFTLSAHNKNQYSVLVTTYEMSDEALYCTYEAEMLSNTMGDCWLVALTQVECSQ